MAHNGSGVELEYYTTDRWISAFQNDYAARMQWTLTGDYRQANHAPSVNIVNRGNGENGGNGGMIKATAGSNVRLVAAVHDPDGNAVATSWWQYFEEGTCNGTVTIIPAANNQANVAIPADAKVGQSISVILQGTDNGDLPLTRYDRVVIQVGNSRGGWPWSRT